MIEQGRNVQNNEELIKVVLIGDSGVGKTNMMTRFCDGIYKNSYVATIGVDFKTKSMVIQNSKLKLQLWDTAGQQRFRAITHNYYRGASGIFLLYSIDNKQSFLNIHSWVQQIHNHTTQPVIKILIASKSDLNSQRQVQINEGQQIAKEYNMKFLQISAKDNINIQESFTTISQQIIQYKMSRNNDHHEQCKKNEKIKKKVNKIIQCQC